MIDLNDLCLNCFKSRGGYEVCPHCGHIHGSAPAQEVHLVPGTLLERRYIIGTVLGSGGFGITYKAWDTQLGSIVAIKEFFPAGLANRVPGESELLIFDGTERTNYKEALARFIDEAKNLAQFNGKANIVNVYGFFEENNTAYIVMEFLDGVSLKEYIEQNGKMPVDTALVIINDLLAGTSDVHSKGILHRDIAPDNIMLSNEGNVKILDFGSARFSADKNEKTLSAFIKPGYAAPEQYASQGEQGVWTDIYGLGATMYYMVTGIKPEESTDRMVNDTVKRPSELGIDLPSEIDKSIMKAMALQIEIRFKTTEEFIAAISGEIPVEYPDVEIKKRKFKRNIIAVISAASLIAAVALTIFFYNYFQIDPYETIVDGTELNMWVYVDNADYDSGKSNMPLSFKAKVEQNKEAQFEKQREAYNDLADNFIKNMSDSYNGKQVKINITVYESAEEYDLALKEAVETDSLPDIFMSGDLYDEIKDKCKDVTEYASIFGNNDYKYITADNYSDIYPDGKLIPLGFNAPVIYVNDALVSDYRISDEDNKEKYDSYEEIQELNKYAGQKLITGFSKGEEVETPTFGIDKSCFNQFIALYSDCLTNEDSSINITDSNSKIIEDLRDSYEQNHFYSPVENYFYYGQLAYFVGDTSIFESVNDYMGGSFRVVPITNNGKSVVTLDNEIALNASLDDNKSLLARAFVEHLLSDDGQAYLDVIIGGSLPIQKKRLEEYCSDVNENFTVVKENYNDAIVIGEHSAADRKVGEKLYDSCYVDSKKPDDVLSLEIDNSNTAE